MSYNSHGGHSYGNQSHRGSGSHSFGKKSHTISARLYEMKAREAKPSIMDIPDKPAFNLVIEDFYGFDDLHKDYPVGSYAVYVDGRAKPKYDVIQVWDGPHAVPSGTATPYGKIISSHQAFNAADNEKFKAKAIAEATERNQAFFKDVANKKARILGISEKKERELAEKNRGQAKLF